MTRSVDLARCGGEGRCVVGLRVARQRNRSIAGDEVLLAEDHGLPGGRLPHGRMNGDAVADLEQDSSSGTIAMPSSIDRLMPCSRRPQEACRPASWTGSTPRRHTSAPVTPARTVATMASMLCSVVLSSRDCNPVASPSVAGLPHALRRRVELARALAADPQVLVLDEPAADLGPAEASDICGAAIGIAISRGAAVLLIEPSIEQVMGVADRGIPLDSGRLIADGRPAEVRHSPEVVASYFGDAHAVGADRAGRRRRRTAQRRAAVRPRGRLGPARTCRADAAAGTSFAGCWAPRISYDG